MTGHPDDVQPVWGSDLPGWANDLISMIVAAQPWPEGSESLAFEAQRALSELADLVDAGLAKLGPVGDVLVGAADSSWDAPATAAFQQNRQGLCYTPGAGLLGVQGNCVAYAMQASNFGTNTEFGKLSINVAVWVALIAAFIVQLAAFLTGGAAEAEMPVIAMSARQTIASILTKLAEAVGERFGAKALTALSKKALTSAAKLAEEGAARQLAKTAGKDALDAAARRALARGTTRRLTNEILRQSAEGVAVSVWANIDQQRRNPDAAWNWNATFSMVLAGGLGFGLGKGLGKTNQALGISTRITSKLPFLARYSPTGTGIRAFTGRTVAAGATMAATMPASMFLANGMLSGQWDPATLTSGETYLGAFLNGTARAGLNFAAQQAGTGLREATATIHDTTTLTDPTALTEPATNTTALTAPEPTTLADTTTAGESHPTIATTTTASTTTGKPETTTTTEVS